MTTEQTQALEAAQAKPTSVLDHYSPEEIKLITDLVAPGIGPGELRLFLTTARAVGLDPLRKQIYAIERWDSQLGRKRMTIQCGIDGYRAIANRSTLYAGQIGPQWCGPDGKWVDVWLAPDPPRAARVGVLRKDWTQPAWGIARWESYVQKNKEGHPTKFWASMGPEQLAKCAESLALRKAFPEDLSGVLTHEEMTQADQGPREAEVLDDGSKATPGAQRQAGRLAAKAKAAASAPAASSAPPATAQRASKPSAQPEPAQEPREVEAEVLEEGQPEGPFAAGDASGTGAITPAELTAYCDPARTEGLSDYQVWPLVTLGPWDSWKGQKMAEKGPLNQWTAEEFVQGKEGGGRHTIGTEVLAKVEAKYGPDGANATTGALRLDYCMAVMARRYDALRLHPAAAAQLDS